MKFVGGNQANNFTYVEDRERNSKKENLKQSKVLLKKILGEKYLKIS